MRTKLDWNKCWDCQTQAKQSFVFVARRKWRTSLVDVLCFPLTYTHVHQHRQVGTQMFSNTCTHMQSFLTYAQVWNIEHRKINTERKVVYNHSCNLPFRITIKHQGRRCIMGPTFSMIKKVYQNITHPLGSYSGTQNMKKRQNKKILATSWREQHDLHITHEICLQ